MELVLYPEDDYTSWINVSDAEDYFDSRMNKRDWSNLDYLDQRSALSTAFRSLGELTLDLSDLDSGTDAEKATLLQALKHAQCEQTMHELSRDLDNQQAQNVSLAGLVSVKFQETKKPTRYSERALAILRPYLSLPSVKRIR